MSATETSETSPSTDIELVKTGSYTEVLSRLIPAKVEGERKIVHEIPQTVVVTDKIVEAIATMKLTMVGAMPLIIEERRPLRQAEVDILSEERDAIDTVIKFLEARKDAHKAMLYNHWDAAVDAAGGDKPPIDAKGHYLTKVSTYAQGGARHFDRQMAEGKPSLTAVALEGAIDVVEGFTRDDYIACTTPVRVLDEAKTTLHMRKNPVVMSAAMRHGIKVGEASSSFYHRPS